MSMRSGNAFIWGNLFRFFMFLQSLDFEKIIFRISFSFLPFPSGYRLFVRACLRNHRWADTGGFQQPWHWIRLFSLISPVLSEQLLSLAEFLSCLWFSCTNVEKHAPPLTVHSSKKKKKRLHLQAAQWLVDFPWRERWRWELNPNHQL